MSEIKIESNELLTLIQAQEQIIKSRELLIRIENNFEKDVEILNGYYPALLEQKGLLQKFPASAE